MFRSRNVTCPEPARRTVPAMAPPVLSMNTVLVWAKLAHCTPPVWDMPWTRLPLFNYVCFPDGEKEADFYSSVHDDVGPART